MMNASLSAERAERRLAVCVEHRFFEFDGELYTQLSHPYSYWRDYLAYFDHVTIVARVARVERLSDLHCRVDGPGVSFVRMPYYVGPFEFVKKLPQLLWSAMKVSFSEKAFLLRSGNVANLVWPFLLIFRRPYLREYPGNIKEGVSQLAGGGAVVSIIARVLHSVAKLQGRFSRANSFVSEYCQELYASARPSFVFSSFSASEISVTKSSYAVTPPLKVVSVGRLELEKGHAVLIQALSEISRDLGVRAELHLVGEGRQRIMLESLAAECGCRVTFHGAITDRQRLFKTIADSDIFVLPSFTEGMPRALLEAMAIGMPCLATLVGGIPEVLPDGAMFRCGDVEDLKRKLLQLYQDEHRMHEWGRRNKRLIAEKYSTEVLKVRKASFWSHLYESRGI